MNGIGNNVKNRCVIPQALRCQTSYVLRVRGGADSPTDERSDSPPLNSRSVLSPVPATEDQKQNLTRELATKIAEFGQELKNSAEFFERLGELTDESVMSAQFKVDTLSNMLSAAAADEDASIASLLNVYGITQEQVFDRERSKEWQKYSTISISECEKIFVNTLKDYEFGKELSEALTKLTNRITTVIESKRSIPLLTAYESVVASKAELSKEVARATQVNQAFKQIAENSIPQDRALTRLANQIRRIVGGDPSESGSAVSKAVSRESDAISQILTGKLCAPMQTFVQQSSQMNLKRNELIAAKFDAYIRTIDAAASDEAQQKIYIEKLNNLSTSIKELKCELDHLKVSKKALQTSVKATESTTGVPFEERLSAYSEYNPQPQAGPKQVSESLEALVDKLSAVLNLLGYKFAELERSAVGEANEELIESNRLMLSQLQILKEKIEDKCEQDVE